MKSPKWPTLDARKKYEFHELANQWPLIEGKEYEDLLRAVQKLGKIRQPIVLYEGKILEGRNRYRIGRELHLPIPYREYDPVEDGDLEQFVEDCNDNRRHEPQDRIQHRRQQRVERIKQKRREGQSLRKIAEEEGVSKEQVRRDLGAGTNGQLSPPGTAEPMNGKVMGRDGKEHPATKTHPPKPAKNGQLSPPGTVEREPGCDDDQFDARDAERDQKKREAAKPKPARKDALGNVVPDNLRDLFGDPVLSDSLADLESARKIITRVHERLKAKIQHYPFTHAKDALTHLSQAEDACEVVRDSISPGLTYAVCPTCKGDCAKCTDCRFSGAVPQWLYQELTQEA